MKFRVSVKYLTWTVILLMVEVVIGVFVHDKFVRPTIGDLLVVILLFCLVMSFIELPVVKTAIGVLIFSFFVEGLQYIHLVKLLGLQHNTFANIMIGNTFQWTDLVAYTVGITIVLVIEKVSATRKTSTTSQP